MLPDGSRKPRFGRHAARLLVFSTWTLRSLANGLYVSAEFGDSGAYFGMLRARASVIGDYEKFFLHRHSYQMSPSCAVVPSSV